MPIVARRVVNGRGFCRRATRRQRWQRRALRAAWTLLCLDENRANARLARCCARPDIDGRRRCVTRGKGAFGGRPIAATLVRLAEAAARVACGEILLNVAEHMVWRSGELWVLVLKRGECGGGGASSLESECQCLRHDALCLLLCKGLSHLRRKLAGDGRCAKGGGAGGYGLVRAADEELTRAAGHVG
eukprot:scaffold83722_cov25-Tisochrysis_lutea.AAC.3